MSDEGVTADVPLPEDVRTFLVETARLYAAGEDDCWTPGSPRTSF